MDSFGWINLGVNFAILALMVVQVIISLFPYKTSTRKAASTLYIVWGLINLAGVIVIVLKLVSLPIIESITLISCLGFGVFLFTNRINTVKFLESKISELEETTSALEKSKEREQTISEENIRLLEENFLQDMSRGEVRNILRTLRRFNHNFLKKINPSFIPILLIRLFSMANSAIKGEFANRLPRGTNIYVSIFKKESDGYFSNLSRSDNIPEEVTSSIIEDLKWGDDFYGITGKCATIKAQIYIPDLEDQRDNECVNWKKSKYKEDHFDQRGFFVAHPITIFENGVTTCEGVIVVFSDVKMDATKYSFKKIEELFYDYVEVLKILMDYL